MKNKANFKSLILIFFGIVFSLSSFAQYTLQDSDVEVIDGVIESCSYAGGETSIIIPQTLDGQTVIGIGDNDYIDGVFVGMELIAVQLPSTLENIGDYAFYENNIVNIDFSICPNLERIGIGSFNANMFTSVDLSDNQNLVILESVAFFQQGSPSPLTSVDLSDCSSLEVIGNSAFAANNISTLSLNGCTALTELQIGAFSNNEISLINISECTSLLYIGFHVFSNNPMTGFSLPVNTQYNSFGWVDGNENAFDGGDFVTDNETGYTVPVTYTIQDADVTIVDGVITEFIYNYEETSITIPEVLQGQTVIGILDKSSDGVFENKGIAEVLFPSTLQFIGDRSFSGNSIASVDLSACTQFTRFGKHSFSGNEITELLIDGATLTLFDDYAFLGNALGDLDFSGYSALKKIGLEAFAENYNGYHNSLSLSNCSSLDTISSSAFCYSYFNSVDFTGCESLKIIGNGAFYYNALSDLDLSPLTSLEVIDWSAFSMNSLTSVDLSGCENLYIIRDWAFDNNADLSEFQLPDADDASLYFWRDNDGNTHSGGDIVSDLSTSYEMPVYTLKDEDVTVVDGYITECIIDFPISGTHLIIPEELDLQPIHGIDDSDFAGVFEAKELERVYLPSTIIQVGDYAFKGNEITSLPLGGYANLLQIGEEAFADNQIETLNVNAYSLAVIDEYAFAGNILTDVNFNSATHLIVIDDYAFASNQITSVTMNNADQLQFIGENAFAVNSVVNFVLPTPDIDGYNFSNWSGTNSSTFAGGATVNNFAIGYIANLASNGHSATFNVTDGTNPIEGAIVSLGSYGVRVTNAAGVAVYESVEDGDFYYEVNAFGFNEYGTAAAQITMAGSNLNENVVMTVSDYQLEFNITDGVNPVSGITVTFDGSDYTSNASGYILIEDLLPGTYSYTISDESYLEVSSSVDVVAVDVVETVELTRIYSVDFTVTDGINPIQDANVNFDGSDYTTNASGQVSISGLEQGTFDYIVSANDYLTVSDYLSVVDNDVEITVELDRVYTLTFDVTDGANPISGASVTFDDVDYTCDVDGQLVLEDVFVGAYSYTVSSNGYSVVTESITVDMNESVEVVLDLVYEVEFYITDGSLPVEGASVLFDGNTYYSNIAGFVTIENVTEGMYNYQINAAGFQPYIGGVTVDEDDVLEVVSLNSVGLEQEALQNIAAYPNPTAGQIKFDGIDTEVSVEVFNAVGQIVMSRVENTNFSIDMSAYGAGVYSVRIINENSNIVVVKRIIKE